MIEQEVQVSGVPNRVDMVGDPVIQNYMQMIFYSPYDDPWFNGTHYPGNFKDVIDPRPGPWGSAINIGPSRPFQDEFPQAFGSGEFGEPNDYWEQLPWGGSGGIQASEVESFSEVRTFAYARAKKDGFWLTCRNAIAQEGMEPALNLAPILPEEGIVDQGFLAFQTMASNNDNGAWGMFHPALALYDVGDGSGPQKFVEGLQLKWDTRTTGDEFLLDKIPTDSGRLIHENDIPQTHPQYQWHPSFSCSGLPLNGALARPNGPAPTDKNEFPVSYKYGFPAWHAESHQPYPTYGGEDPAVHITSLSLIHI